MNLKRIFIVMVLSVFTACFVGSISFAQEGISEDQMKEMFDQASKKYKGNRGDKIVKEVKKSGEVLEAPTDNDFSGVIEGADPDSLKPVADVTLLPDVDIDAPYMREPEGGYMPLDDIQMTINLENQTVRQVIDAIVKQASSKSGHWKVKWRLRKSNNFLLNEKVNITAETTFDQFMEYLVDRINNMTGVQLFVTRFDASRIIIISDTYY